MGFLSGCKYSVANSIYLSPRVHIYLGSERERGGGGGKVGGERVGSGKERRKGRGEGGGSMQGSAGGAHTPFRPKFPPEPPPPPFDLAILFLPWV